MAVHQHASVNRKVQNLESGHLDRLDRLISLFDICGNIARPDFAQLRLLEEIDPRAVAPDVEVLIEIATLLESHLRQIATPVIAEKHFATGLEQGVNVPHGLRPLIRRQGREDENHHDEIHRTGLEAGWQHLARCVPDVRLKDSGLLL